MMNNDRVLLGFTLKNGNDYSLIVSREKAEKAIQTWKNGIGDNDAPPGCFPTTMSSESNLTIEGVVDHRDNNGIKFVVALEAIELINICEIKSL